MFLSEGYRFRFLEGYTSGFSLSFKVDSQNVKVGGLAIKCCRQFKDFTPSLYPFTPRNRWLRPQIAQLFSRLMALNENPDIFWFLSVQVQNIWWYLHLQMKEKKYKRKHSQSGSTHIFSVLTQGLMTSIMILRMAKNSFFFSRSCLVKNW